MCTTCRWYFHVFPSDSGFQLGRPLRTPKPPHPGTRDHLRPSPGHLNNPGQDDQAGTGYGKGTGAIRQGCGARRNPEMKHTHLSPLFAPQNNPPLSKKQQIIVPPELHNTFKSSCIPSVSFAVSFAFFDRPSSHVTIVCETTSRRRQENGGRGLAPNGAKFIGGLVGELCDGAIALVGVTFSHPAVFSGKSPWALN